jgi:hypothetical protein
MISYSTDYYWQQTGRAVIGRSREVVTFRMHADTCTHCALNVRTYAAIEDAENYACYWWR